MRRCKAEEILDFWHPHPAPPGFPLIGGNDDETSYLNSVISAEAGIWLTMNVVHSHARVDGHPDVARENP